MRAIERAKEKRLWLRRCRDNPALARQAAVSDRSGGVRFATDPSQTGNSHIEPGAGEEVRSIAVDDYLRDEQIASVAMMKIDVKAASWRRCAARASRLPPGEFRRPKALIDYLDGMGHQVCFCRQGDLEPCGGGSHTIREGLPGEGVQLIAVIGHTLPAMIDLLAVPREHAVARA